MATSGAMQPPSWRRRGQCSGGSAVWHSPRLPPSPGCPGCRFVILMAQTLVHYRRLLRPSYLITLQSTIALSFLVTGVRILLGYQLAYVIAQARAHVPALLLLLVLFPIWTSLLVRCYAWLVLLQRRSR